MDIVLYIAMLIIPLISQIYIQTTYKKYKTQKNSRNISGFEVARAILDANGLEKVHIVEVQGLLSDHYDPARKVIRLSTDVFHNSTIASSSIAAHEVGHAIQHKTGYNFLKIRTALFPFANITSYLAYILLIVSLFLQMAGMFWLSVALMLFSLLFQLVTLPVEFNASQRAKEELQKLNLASSKEMSGVDSMLRSAALTYVASLVASLMQVLRLIIIFQRRD